MQGGNAFNKDTIEYLINFEVLEIEMDIFIHSMKIFYANIQVVTMLVRVVFVNCIMPYSFFGL